MTETTKPSAGTIDGLAAALAQRLEASLLPSDGALSPDELTGAARFVAETAYTRKAGEMALAIDTVSAEQAGGRRFMRVAVINEDMPFLVDSIAHTLSAHGHTIDRLIHPVVAVERDGKGQLTHLPEAAIPGMQRESMVYIETRRADARARTALADALAVTLADVRAAVADWPAMQAVMAHDADVLAALDRPEGAAMLRWFRDGMLTQLGHVTRHRDGSQTGALGICKQSSAHLLSADSFTRAFAWFDHCIADGGSGLWPLAVKSNLIAHVHRRVPLDLFLQPVIEDGRAVALSVHAGVWTSAALAAPPTLVPRMRSQLAKLMSAHGFSPNGHAGKALVHALTKLPHDLLISFSDADLQRVSLTMMSLIDRPRPRLALVAAALERHVFGFVWLPRDALSTAMREQIAAMLGDAIGGRLLDWTLEVEGSSLAQLFFVFDVRENGGRTRKTKKALPDEAALDARLQEMMRGWVDALELELAASDDLPGDHAHSEHGHIEHSGRAAALAARYAEAFPQAYRSQYGAHEAAVDLLRLRALPTTEQTSRGVRLYRLPSDADRRMRLKVYQRQGALTLSGAVPALEHFGFRVIDTLPTELVLPAVGNAPGEVLGTIHDFLLALPQGCDIDTITQNTPAIETAMTAVANGAGENDPFNRLIVAAELVAEEANWLRAWYRYLRQAGMSFSIGTVVDALGAAPHVTRALIALFRAFHQPGVANRMTAAAKAEDAIRDGLANVAAINDDRLLRAFRAVVCAMLRTNAFAPRVADGTIPLAFKLDSAAVPGLPKPLPWREIFVYSAQVEGIHLRAGPVARGGLRWSDRRDDFRTEVLGLMKAQRVKNAVIVPTGAKGGFYPKRLPDPARDRDAWAAEGRASYQQFLRALLSVTDNIIEGKVVHPAQVTVHDGEDPYFVVAADKGTATFSDTANALAAEADFWLDDAFASGGSKGYDHKAMGITAKGAWLSVQRHFLELGVDVQTDPVRVVGVGDMSGDVFGNGMLLSKSLKVVAAFDHRHIFLDPDPDPAAAHAERARLFALPRSSWADYNAKWISKGGGIFPRGQKEIPLSPEIRAALGIDAETIDPESLMRAIITAPVDLLWFGGIGTYVKGSSEANSDVGDPANDTIRINGRDLRVRVIGEGANLGCTQAARIEYALKGGAVHTGGRNNTDFIDNSAGVDCSDKEVNIKIALASAKRAGRLDEEARVKLLVSMTDDVAALVLEDNRLQALGLSIAQGGGVSAVPAYTRLMETLEEGGHLDCATEGLADAETLMRRAADGAGLTRPELAVLLSSTKLVIQDALENSTVPDDPGLEGELLAAFPPAMRDAFAQDILNHRLRREIISTRLANRLVNRMGFVHPFELAEEECASLAEVTAAFIAADKLFGMDAIWARIETEPMPEAARILLFERAADALRSHMADLLRAGAGREPPAQLAAALAPGVAAIAGMLQKLLKVEASALSARIRGPLADAQAPAQLADDVTRLFDLDASVGLAALSRDNGRDTLALTQAFLMLGGPLGLDWAQTTAVRMAPSDPWERLLVAGLARDFQQMRFTFLRALDMDGREPEQAVEAWLSAHQTPVRQFRALIDRARAHAPVTAAMLAQIAGQARGLLAR